MKRKRNNEADSEAGANAKQPKKPRGRTAKPPGRPEPKIEDDHLSVDKLNGAKAGSKTAVDEACPIKSSAEVFVDDDVVNYDASLSLSNIDGNNNKFYYVQLLVAAQHSSGYAVWTHWGRVGENGQNKLKQNLGLMDAKASFVKKFKDKTGLSWEKRRDPPKANKYTLIEKSYGRDSDDEAVLEEEKSSRETGECTDQPSCTLCDELQQLVRFLFDAGNMKSSMASQNYNFNKLPLGKLSKGTIEKGYLALKELGDVILDPKLAKSKHHSSLEAAFNHLTSRYYTIIPHDFGRRRPVPIDNQMQLKTEMDLVETLGNMQISNEIMRETEFPKNSHGSVIHPLDAQLRSLALQEVVPLKKGSSEFCHLEKYFYHSNDGHNVIADATIKEIYRISRSQDIGRFITGGFDADGMKKRTVHDHRRLLWHGSRGCNFGGILSQGLRIAPPEAPANGKAFGKGIYLADRASKSAAYCDPWTSGQTSLLLLCETQLGDPSYVRQRHEYAAAESMRNQGLISTKMLENPHNEPSDWMNAKVVNDDLDKVLLPDHDVKLPTAVGNPNEYIVYDVAQIKIRYVFMLKWKNARQWGIY